MKCQKYHELISAFIDNELSLKETLKLKRHLKSCRSCTEELKIVSKIQYEFQKEAPSLVTPQPGEEFSLKVMNVIRNIPVQEKQRTPVFLSHSLLIMKDWFVSLRRRPVIAYSSLGVAAVFLLLILLFPAIQNDKLQTVYELTQKETTVAADRDIDHYVREYVINASENSFDFREDIIQSVSYNQ